MADNVAITAGSGTTIATDDIGGVQFQRFKPAVGPDGTAVDVSTTAPMPTRPGTYTTNAASRKSVTSAADGTSLASSNSGRLGMKVVNRDTAVPIVIVFHASSAGASYAAALSEAIVLAGDEWNMDPPIWLGAVYAISSSGTTIPVDVTDKSA